MTLGRFTVGMLFVLLAVTLWSWQDGASWGMIAIRFVVSAIVLQIGYFAGVAYAARRTGPAHEAPPVAARKDEAPTRRPGQTGTQV